MKRNDMAPLIGAIVFCTIVAFILSSVIFKGHPKNYKVPTAEDVTTQFPDVRNDPKYSSIFNNKALDPAQPIQLDNNNNSTVPFSGT